MHWQRWCSSEPVFRTLHPHPHPCPCCHAKTVYPRITRSPFTLHSPSPNVILCFFLSLALFPRKSCSQRKTERGGSLSCHIWAFWREMPLASSKLFLLSLSLSFSLPYLFMHFILFFPLLSLYSLPSTCCGSCLAASRAGCHGNCSLTAVILFLFLCFHFSFALPLFLPHSLSFLLWSCCWGC